MAARDQLELAKQQNRDRYLANRSTVSTAKTEKSHAAAIYLGYDSTIEMARIKLISNSKIMNARVITNGGIVVGAKVMAKIDGPIAFINEMPA